MSKNFMLIYFFISINKIKVVDVENLYVKKDGI